MKNTILRVACLIVFSVNYSFGQPGSLDSDFSADGKVTTDFGSGNDWGYATAIQNDGKILVAGSASNGTNQDIAIVRYYPDGTLDNTFSFDGKVTTSFGNSNDVIQSIAIQSDGKILAAGISSAGGGYYNFALVRYNSDGSLDNTFNIDGKVTTDIGGKDDHGRSIAIQSDGKILVAGDSEDNSMHYDFALIRYNADGTIDSTFNGNGKIITDFGSGNDFGSSVAIQPDGKILVAGYADYGSDRDFAIVRYNTDGTIDSTFSFDGKVTTDFNNHYDVGSSVIILPDGKILVAGYSNNGSDHDFALARYNTDGTLDITFNTDGKVTTDYGNLYDVGFSHAIQADEKILVAGYSYNGVYDDYNFEVIRYTADGMPDSTFNTDGIVITDFGSDMDIANSIAIQPDGKIVVAGYTDNGTDKDFAVARYISGVDIGYDEIQNKSDQLQIYPNPATDKITLLFSEKATIEILNMQGQMVGSIITADNEITIDVSDLSSGIYIIKAKNEKGISVRRFVRE